MSKTILVSLIALIAVISLISVSANGSLDITVNEVKLNGIDITSGSNYVAGEAGEVVPISIYFTANENASEVEVSAWMQGHRKDVTEIDFRDLIEGKDYIARLSLQLPSDIEPEEDLTLYIRIESDAGNWEENYTVAMQRQPYNAKILFVETDNSVRTGSSVPIDVVIKNIGRHDLEDLVVSASVPELGISKRAYFGDLAPTDMCDDECDKEDAIERRIYLNIPTNVKAGVYELIVEASNPDVRSTVKKNIVIVGTEQSSNVLVPVTTKAVASGQSITYDLIIVNPGNSIGVYEIIPETVEGLIVTVTEPIITVQAGSSKAVKVEVKAGNKEGTYAFALNINSGNTLVQRVSLTANVTEKAITSNITILVIVLAIIFVVLLIVLIVLLTRKPAKEELEESYY